MSDKEKLLKSLENIELSDKPFPHGIITDALTKETIHWLNQLKIEKTEFDQSNGKRVSDSATRFFLNKKTTENKKILNSISETFNDIEIRKKISATFDVNIERKKCRIEICHDRDGFWLKPHTDLNEKLITFIIYTGPTGDKSIRGTDLFNETLDHVKEVPYKNNSGLIFRPSDKSWHGVKKQEMKYIRKVIIINYVQRSWVDIHQLT